MAILIKNPDVERRVRDLAALTGESLTSTIDAAVKSRLDEAAATASQRPSLADMIAATERFRRAIGMDHRTIDTSKAAFDDLNEIPGLEPDH